MYRNLYNTIYYPCTILYLYRQEKNTPFYKHSLILVKL